MLGLCLNGGSAVWAWGLARYNLRFWGVIGDRSGIKRKEKAAAGGSGSVRVGSGEHPLREHEAACKAEMARTAAATTDATALEHKAELLAEGLLPQVGCVEMGHATDSPPTTQRAGEMQQADLHVQVYCID